MSRGRTVPLALTPGDLDWSKIWVQRSGLTDVELEYTLNPYPGANVNALNGLMTIGATARQLSEETLVGRGGEETGAFRNIQVTGSGATVLLSYGDSPTASVPVFIPASAVMVWPRDVMGLAPVACAAVQRLFPWNAVAGLATGISLEQPVQVSSPRGTLVVEWTPQSPSTSMLIQIDEIHGQVFVPQTPQTFTSLNGIQRRMVDLTEGSYRVRCEVSGASATTFSASIVSYNP